MHTGPQRGGLMLRAGGEGDGDEQFQSKSYTLSKAEEGRQRLKEEEVKDGGRDSDVLLTTCSFPAVPSF